MSPQKARQRRHGEGSITEASPGVWRAFKPPDATGRRSSRRFTSREAAHRWLVGEPEPIVLFLGQYLARWHTLRAPTLRGRSVQTYQQFLGYADDTDAPLTSIALEALTSDDCQAWLNALLRTHTLDSVRVARGVVSAALNAATLSGLIPANPMKGTKLPKPGEREVRAWMPAEVGRLLRAAEGSHHAVWLSFAIGTGLRLGELRALEWADLDLQRLTVRVSKSLDNNSNARGPTKTGRARTVDVPEELRGALVEHKARQPAGQRLVFGRGARPFRPQTYRDWLKRLCLRAGVEVLAVHSTRHTFASLALADPECALPDVSHALGHAQMATTLNVYGHYLNHQQRRTAKALGRVLAPVGEIGPSNPLHSIRH